MTLDDLVSRFKTKSEDPIVHHLGALLVAWKQNDKTAKELDEQVEHYLETTSSADEPAINNVRHTWRQFRADVIDQIGGMTMNERLYHFSLFDRFESSTSDAEKATIYQKLHAKP